MPGLVPGETGNKFEALMIGAAAVAGGSGTGMRLIHDDEFRAGAEKLVTPLIRLDVIQRDDDDGVLLENTMHPGRQIIFQPGSGGGGHQGGFQMEFIAEFALPLIHQMRRADDGQTGDFATIAKFAGDERGLNGFADTDVVRDEEPHGVLPQRHQQRHKLIRTRLNGDTGEATKRAGGGAHAQTRGFAQQTG